MTLEDMKHGSFTDLSAGWNGYLLTIALHREVGGCILVHEQMSRLAVQLEMDGIVIDSMGARPIDAALEDLEKREVLRPVSTFRDPFFGAIKSEPVRIFRFDTEESFRDAFEEKIKEMGREGISEESIRWAEESVPYRRIMESGVMSCVSSIRNPEEMPEP